MSEEPYDFKEQLKEKGYKFTTQRQLVLDTIEMHEGEHLSTEEIYDIVRKNHPEIGLATIYRALLLLEKMGIVQKIDLDDGYSRYELNTRNEDHSHHHLICTQCGAVIAVEEDLLESLEEQILKKYDFVVKDHRLKLYGLCKNCLDDR